MYSQIKFNFREIIYSIKSKPMYLPIRIEGKCPASSLMEGQG